MITLELPYPLSVNHLYSFYQGRVFMKKAGKDYKETVRWIFYSSHIKTDYFKEDQAKLIVVIRIFLPDHRYRDSDNLAKIVLDSLQYAGVYKNDSQIFVHLFRKYLPEQHSYKNGSIIVHVGLITDPESIKFIENELLDLKTAYSEQLEQEWINQNKRK